MKKNKLLILLIIGVLVLSSIATSESIKDNSKSKSVGYVPEHLTDSNLLNQIEKYTLTAKSDNLNQSNESIEPNTDDEELPVIIVLKNQPLQETSREIKEKHKEKVEDYKSKITHILGKDIKNISKDINDIEKQEVYEKEIRNIGAEETHGLLINSLSNQERRELANLKEELDDEFDSLKKEIFREQKKLVEDEQDNVKEIVNICGGSVN